MKTRTRVVAVASLVAMGGRSRVSQGLPCGREARPRWPRPLRALVLHDNEPRTFRKNMGKRGGRVCMGAGEDMYEGGRRR